LRRNPDKERDSSLPAVAQNDILKCKFLFS
jgi:hypothetical protein